MLAWVVGSGGLLGGAVARATASRFVGSPIPWGDPRVAKRVLEADLERFASVAAGREWSIVWAAGSAVIASRQSDLERETELLNGFVSELQRRHPSGPGAFFLASSAGGVYAGSTNPPFSESTVPRPVSAYGETKLDQERLTTEVLGPVLPVVIGRISNLYGPAQNLTKSQGLVSHLCRSAAIRDSVNLFVPMETLRDYLYVDDAAEMVVALLRRAVGDMAAGTMTRNLASERPTPVAGVVRTVQQVARRPIRIALGSSPVSASQVRDLRIVSSFRTEASPVSITPLPVGVKRVYEHTLWLLREGTHAG